MLAGLEEVKIAFVVDVSIGFKRKKLLLDHFLHCASVTCDWLG